MQYIWLEGLQIIFLLKINSVVETALVLRLLCYFNKVFGIVKSVMWCYNSKKDLQLGKISGRCSHHLLMAYNWGQLPFFTNCIYKEFGFFTFGLLNHSKACWLVS